MFYWVTISVTILANVLYHLFQKQIATSANPIASLIVTYTVALLFSLAIYPMFATPGQTLIGAIKGLNWASYALAIGIFGLEIGFLLAYRAGWNLSSAALYSNVCVALILLPIGLVFFKESLSKANALGVVLALASIVLLAQK